MSRNKNQKKHFQKVVNLSLSNSRDFASFSQSINDSKWEGSGEDILMSLLYLRSKRYPEARIEFPHEKLDYSSKDMMWKLVIKFTCKKSIGKFKIEFPGGEENYFTFLNQAINRHHKYLEKNKIYSQSIKKKSLNKKSFYNNSTKKKYIEDSQNKILFIVNGIFLGDQSCNPQLGHYNILSMKYNVKKNSFLIERIEPYGRVVSNKKIEKE